MKKTTRILLAEDDPNFGMMLSSFLQLHQYEVNWTKNGNEALKAFQNQPYDICIFDVMMPDKDGFSLAEDLAKLKSTTPFVYLTAKALKEDQIKGFQLGAIDYLIKPFDPEILLLKIQAILQQVHPQEHSLQEQQVGSYQFDPVKRTLSLNGNLQKLTPKEAALLELLLSKKGALLSRSEALLKIWKEDTYFTAQSMNVFITKLRKYLNNDPIYHITIENIHSSGFVLGVSRK